MEITKELIKIFTDWTKLKIRIHVLGEIALFPRRKEIWWASLGQNIGVEINGKNDNFERPILVIKTFNPQSSLVAPISGKVKEGKYFVEFINPDGQKNMINLSQLKTISSKRLLRKIGVINGDDFTRVKNVLKKFF